MVTLFYVANGRLSRIEELMGEKLVIQNTSFSKEILQNQRLYKNVWLKKKSLVQILTNNRSVIHV